MKKLLVLFILILGLNSQEAYAGWKKDVHHAESSAHHAASSASSDAHHAASHVESAAQKAADKLKAKAKWLAAHIPSGDCRCCPGGEWKMDKNAPVYETITIDNPAYAVYEACQKTLKKAREPYETCQAQKKHIEGQFKKLKVSPEQAKEAIIHEVTTKTTAAKKAAEKAAEKARTHAIAAAKEAPGKAKAAIADAQAAPGKALQVAKNIIAALPKTPQQAIADVKKAEKEAEVLGKDILKFLVTAEHEATKCHCTFLKWPNQKDITTLDGIRSQTYTWPQAEYKPTEKAKFCGAHVPHEYTVSYNATEDEIQAAFKKAVPKALHTSQKTINTTSQTLADAREKLNGAQVKLIKAQQKLDGAATPVTNEIATLMGAKTKIAQGLVKIAPIKTILLKLVPSDSVIIKSIGKHEISTDDIAKLNGDVKNVCELLVMFQSITQEKATKLQDAIKKTLLASNKMLEARAKITLALAKLKTALKKVENAITTGKTALQKSQATITAAQEAVDTGYNSLEKSIQTVHKIVIVMKHVMGINITLNSNIAHLAPIVLTARQRQKERQEAIEKQEHEMPPLHGAPGYKGIGPKHGPLDR